MQPEKFYRASLDVIEGQNNSSLLVGYAAVSARQNDYPQHQFAVAINQVDSIPSITVLSANTDPDDDTIKEFSLDITPENEDLAQQHIGINTAPGIMDLRNIDTIVDQADITAAESQQPDEAGIYDGEVFHAAGTLALELFTVKDVDTSFGELRMNAELYASLPHDI
jgi:hypothetical protein